nr:MAG: RNA-dependent RNA polymerase [Riboviria sp.]
MAYTRNNFAALNATALSSVCAYDCEFPKAPANLRFASKDFTPHYKGQRLGRKSSREDRDRHQRSVSRQRLANARKLENKRLRSDAIRQARRTLNEARYGIREEGFVENVHTAGRLAELAILAGGVFVTPKVLSFLGNCAKKVTSILNNVDSSTSHLNSIAGECSKLVRVLKETANKVVGKLWIIPVSVLAYWLLSKFVGNKVAILVLMGVFGTIFGKQLWSKVSPYFTAHAVIREESGLGALPFKGIIIGILCFAFLPKDAGKLVGSLMNRISVVPRLGDGLDGLFKIAIDIAEKVFNFVYKMAGIKDEDGNIKVAVFGDESTKMVKKWLNTSYGHMSGLVGTPNPTFIKEVHDHVKQGYVILQTLKDQPMINLLSRGIDNLEAKLAPFMGVITAGKNFRVEPHFVLFTGRSGVGKSSILVKFAVSVLLLAGMCKPDEVLSHLWQKGASEYWNGYVNQLCVVMDDVFQKVASKGDSESEYMDIIRIISNWSAPLNMADLKSKGKFYFDSPLVLGTTNCSNIKETTYQEVVKSSEAVVRRIHDVIYIEAAKDFATEKQEMDYEKVESLFRERLLAAGTVDTLTPEQIVDCIPWEAWRADRVDFTSHVFSAYGQPYNNAIDMRKLVVDVAEKIKRKRAYHNESLESLEAFATLLGKAKAAPKAEVKASAEDIKPQSGLADHKNQNPSDPDADMDVIRGFQSFAGIARLYSPEVDSAKLKNQCRVHKKRMASLDGLARAKKADAEFFDPGLYINSMLRFVALFDPEELEAHNEQKVQPTLEKLSKMFQDKTTSRFFKNGEEITFTDIEHRLNFISEILSDEDACAQVGINSNKHVAIYSWIKRTRSDMDEVYDMIAETHKATEEMTSIKELCKSMVRGVWRNIKKLQIPCACNKVVYITMIVSLLAVLGGYVLGFLKTVYSAICSLFGAKPNEDETKVVFEEPTVVTQSNHQSVLQDDAVYNKIYANQYTLYLPRTDVLIGQMMFVNAGLAVMPNHYDRQLTDKIAQGDLSSEDTIVAYNGAQKYSKLSMTLKQFMAVPRYHDDPLKSDTVFLNFPHASNLMGKSNIINHFVSEDKYKSVSMAVLPVRLDITRIAKVNEEVRLQRNTMFAPVVRRVNELPIGKITPPFVWCSGMTTRVGDCGSPLMISRRDVCPDGKCILGIHVGGNACPIEPKACAIPVSQEMIMRAMKYHKVIVDNFEEDLAGKGIKLSEPTLEVQAGLYESGLIAGSFELIGEVDKPVSMAPRSRFTHTPLHRDEPFGPSGLKPAHLSPTMVDGVLKYPMVEGLKNYQSQLEWRDIPDLDLIVGVAMQKFSAASVYDTREIFTFEEAVVSPALLKLKAVNRATSPGYPFVLDGQPGKTAYFGNLEEYTLTGPKCDELRERCAYIISQAKQGVRLCHICVDFLKDETRPEKKVDACATRVISGSPVDYVIAFRQLFGAFMAAMFRNHTVSGFTPGINPYQEWWVLAQKLKDAGPNHFDGDFSRFDASEQPYVLWAILRYINQWYGDSAENQLAREVLWMDLVHSRHLTSQFGGLKYLVQWNKSLPSGHPITTPCNSAYAMIALVLCYNRLTKGCLEYWAHAYSATNGDDNVTSVDDERKDVFNQVTVAAAMQQYLGLTYTSGRKDGELKEFSPLDEITFLKRSFVRDEGNEMARGGWLAPLDKQSFLYSAYFSRAKRDIPGDICSNLEFALGELSLHQDDMWNQYAGAIFEQMARFEYAPKYGCSRDAYRQYMASRTDFWY